MNFFYSNITSFSEQAKTFFLDLEADAVFLTETHKNQVDTRKMIREMKNFGFQCTASPARQSAKSKKGTQAGALVGVRTHRDSRPLSLCTDAQGHLTSNSNLTGRLMTINWVEVLMLSAYIEGDSFEGRNLDTLTDINHWTRGGRDPFILALDANRDPKAWDTFMAGDKTWLALMNAEIVTVTNSEFTCVAGKSPKGGSMIY
jgi:hypothetical protein